MNRATNLYLYKNLYQQEHQKLYNLAKPLFNQSILINNNILLTITKIEVSPIIDLIDLHTNSDNLLYNPIVITKNLLIKLLKYNTINFTITTIDYNKLNTTITLLNNNFMNIIQKYNKYKEIKNKYPDAILLFREGNFYKCFCDDATIVSETLEITLSKKEISIGKYITLTGFQADKLDNYLPKLIRAGHRVAICDYMPNLPKPTKPEKTVVPIINNQPDLFSNNNINQNNMKKSRTRKVSKHKIKKRIANKKPQTPNKPQKEFAFFIVRESKRNEDKSYTNIRTATFRATSIKIAICMALKKFEYKNTDVRNFNYSKGQLYVDGTKQTVPAVYTRLSNGNQLSIFWIPVKNRDNEYIYKINK